ncbi:MAG: YqgE/AlgH family protein [Flavobacteriales bacterium]
MIKITPENTENPSRGKILLSEPFLTDPYFKRAAILLCEHNDEGSFGFVLNNYLDMSLDQIMKGLPELTTRVSLGGPVNSSNLYYLHTLGSSIIDSKEIANGIYLGGDFERLKEEISKGNVGHNQVKFFVGYSGWSANQLEEEMAQNSWYVAEAKPEIVMNIKSDNLWAEFLESMGSKYSKMIGLPTDPNLN